MTQFFRCVGDLLQAAAKEDPVLALRILMVMDSLERRPTLGKRLAKDNFWFYRTEEFTIYYNYNAATKDILVVEILLF